MKFRRELVGSTTATLILSVLNSGSAHGYEIVRRINELSDGIFEWQEGTIYPALHKLEEKELIRGQWVEASNGKMRRVYSLTDDGKRTLIADAKEWTVYSKAVENILEACYA
jgi:PadR family transcriptional regulator, regulatory protein PadR